MLKLLKDNIKENKRLKLSNQEKHPSFKGQEIIRFIAKTLPNKPGVYQMEDENGKLLSAAEYEFIDAANYFDYYSGFTD